MHLALPSKRDEIIRDAEERPSASKCQDEEAESTVADERLKEWMKQQELYYNFDTDYKGIDWRERYDLEDPEWRFDPIPEIIDGQNVLDFWTPDIDVKLKELEKEEIARLRRVMLEEDQEEELPELTPEEKEKLHRIREKRTYLLQRHRMRRGANHPRLPAKYNAEREKNIEALEKHITSMGMVGSEVVERVRERSRSRSQSRSRTDSKATSRSRSESRSGRKRTRHELDSRGLSVSRTVSQSRAFKDPASQNRAERLAKRARRSYSRDGRKGEGDRHVFDLKPKHLFSGKSTIGKKDRR